MVQATLTSEVPRLDGWRVLYESLTEGRLKRRGSEATVVQWQLVDETDANPERAVLAAFARLAITLHDPPEMQRLLIIPDQPPWRAAAALLTVRAQRVFALRIIAVMEMEDGYWARPFDLWGDALYGGLPSSEFEP